MNNKLELNKEYITDIKTHFRKEYENKMDADFVKNTLISFDKLNANNPHPITLSLKGFLFYAHIEISDTLTSANFVGDSGGVGLGLSVADGSLFTAGGFSYVDIYKQTVSFQINSLIAYLNVNFFNSNSQLLGHIQAEALGFGFIGGGNGKWDNY